MISTNVTPSPHSTASGSPAAWAAFLAPGAMGAFTLAVVVGSFVGWNPLWPTHTLTLSEAVALRDLASVQTMIGNGVDPNARYRTRPELVKSDGVELTPLEAAITTRELYLFEALLAIGATVDAPTRLRLTCFAQQERAKEIAAFLATPLSQPIDCTTVVLPW